MYSSSLACQYLAMCNLSNFRPTAFWIPTLLGLKYRYMTFWNVGLGFNQPKSPELLRNDCDALIVVGGQGVLPTPLIDRTD